MPHACHRFWKCHKTLKFFSFLTRCIQVHNPLPLPRKTTSESPKVLCIPWVFYPVDFEMCFAPQRRSLFRHLNFQKCSEHGVFCAFWLGNVLRATTACTFSPSKSAPNLVCFVILTWKCALCHNSVQFFISHLGSWLRTRCFSEPTFRPSGPTNHWKNTVSPLSYFFGHLDLLSSETFSFWSSLFSALLCSALLFSALLFFSLLFSSLLLSSLLFSPLLSSSLLSSPLTPPIFAFHLPILSEVSEVWPPNFLRLFRLIQGNYISGWNCVCKTALQVPFVDMKVGSGQHVIQAQNAAPSLIKPARSRHCFKLQGTSKIWYDTDYIHAQSYIYRLRNTVYSGLQYLIRYDLIWFGLRNLQSQNVDWSQHSSQQHHQLDYSGLCQNCHTILQDCGLIMFCQRVSSRRPKCFQPVLLTSPPPEFASRLCVPHLVFGAKRYVRSLSR